MSFPTINLTDNEREIFDLFLEAAREDLPVGAEPLVVRVVGGWVRDKLLGLESNDIDIALEICSGQEFARRVNRVLSRRGGETHRVGIIAANPEQSKHLETATILVNDVWIDCVNLRTESYADSSRIPEIRCGTPQEDAVRRDFTINALFFNINTNQIEDFSGSGLSDIQRRVIRTPLPPIITFNDDPLRVSLV